GASTVLKGAHRSSADLMAAAGYQRRSDEFQVLLRILDSELRLITPAESAEPGDRPDTGIEPRAHLTSRASYPPSHHTPLPSVRQWLARKQHETRRGRAELRLAERSDFWNSRPEPRQLASFSEWLTILLWTRTRDWTAPERKMMRSAGVRYVTGALTAAVLF